MQNLELRLVHWKKEHAPLKQSNRDEDNGVGDNLEWLETPLWGINILGET